MWNPSFSFLKSGQTSASLSYGELERFPVYWTFQRSQTFPCQLVQCTLMGKGQKVCGFAYDIFSKNAMRISLAEAWERFVFQTYRDNPKSPEHVRFTTTGYAAGASEELAIRSAENEFRERYLLYLAGNHETKIEKFEFKDPLSVFLVSCLENKWKTSLHTCLYRDSIWGTVLLAWMQTAQGFIYDSSYLEDFSVKNMRHLLLSLLVTHAAKQIELTMYTLPHKALKLVHDCTKLQTQLIYSGENLPSVAVAFHSFTSQHSNLNQWTQDQLFARFFRKIFKPIETQHCS